jgi:signal transduction histidine kinase
MTESIAAAARDRRRPGAGAVRIGRRTLAESLYLLTAPVIAGAGLLLVLGALCLGTAVSLLPGGSRAAGAVLAPARWFAGLERWRIAQVRPGTGGAARWPRLAGTAAVSDRGLWLDAAHAVVAFPVALVTSVVTALWWFAGLGAATSAVRDQGTSAGPVHPVFGTALGLLLLLTLPLVTRACLAAQTGLGQALLSEAAALRRRITGLERERDAARAQTVAAVTAEAAALRRLERDIHDGPQQRLVRLAMELGRAQHNLDRRPEAAREALADAVVQAQEALEELRALSRGIAPPVLADRGLRAALTALAARSTVPADLDTGPLDRRLGPGAETAAYFVVAEALTNVAKHSHATRCVIGLRQDGGTLRVWVTDDGAGGAALAKGHGLRGLDDRLRAAGGRLTVTSPSGGPTTVAAELPCR